MGWADIKDRIEVPIMTDDGIECMVDYFFSKGHITTKEIVMHDYRKPADADMTESEKTDLFRDIKFRITKYYLKKVLSIINEKSKEKKYIYVKDYFPRFVEETKSRSYTNLKVTDLIKIYNMSQEELNNYNSDDYIKSYINILMDRFDFVIEYFHQKEEILSYSNSDLKKVGYSTKRLYMNGDNNNRKKFLFIEEFVKRCIDSNLPFKLKPQGPSTDSLDNLVIYSNSDNVDKHIDLIESILNEHPEFREVFGDPIPGGGNIRSKDGKKYYAVTSDVIKTAEKPKGYTPNDYQMRIASCAAQLSFSKLIKKYLSDEKIKTLLLKELDETKIKEYVNKVHGKLTSAFAKTDLININKDNIDKFIASIHKYNELDLDKSKIQFEKIKFSTYMRYYILNIIKYMNERFGHEFKNEFKAEFKKNILLVNSLFKCGDTSHTDIPFYMDELFYKQTNGLEIVEPKKTETDEDILFVKSYINFINKNIWKSVATNEFKAMPKEVQSLVLKVRSGDSIGEEDYEVIMNMAAKHNLLTVVKSVVDKYPDKKKELEESVKEEFGETKEVSMLSTLSPGTPLLYTRLKIINHYYASITPELAKLPVEKRHAIIKLKKASSPKEIEESLDEIEEMGLKTDIWNLSQLIRSRVGEKANQEFNDILESTKKKKSL